ncbi:MAG: sugar phosphate nucleotidyltransferase [Bacteroidales bacterium]|nr:sugar phosphate nucleotidyltransferase [Bacteroidales bacterium]MEE0266788.1 sugar phosphate nucleotidyltransferase [Bacteroidales bacterium]
MKIVIPMAGMGKRLRPHTLVTPKPLIELAGKPIVQHLCEDIREVVGEEIEEIGFIIGDFGKEVENNLLKIAEQLNTKGKIYYQKEPLGTAHAILCAKESLSGKVTVAFADTLFDAGFTLETKEDGIIWTHKVEDPSAFGVVKKNADQTICGFVEKPKEFVSNEAIIGIYYFKDGENLRNELQYLIDNNITKSGEYQLTDALQNMLDKGLKFKTNDVKEWLDCGNPQATVETCGRVLELKQNSEKFVSDEVANENSLIIPPVYIGKGAVIKNCVIGPRVSIAEGCKISDSCIKDTMVGNQTVIENAVLKNSMIGSFAKIENKEQKLNLGDYSCIN